MPGAVIANWPLSLIIIVVIVGLVLVPTYRFKHTKPSHRDAREHFRVKERVDKEGPRAALATPDYVPAERVNPLDGLTVPHDEGAGQQSGRPGHTPTPGDLEPTSGSTGGSMPKTRAELYEIAKERELPGRSKMGRDELASKLGEG